MTKAELKAQILRWSYNRTDLDDVLDDFILLAESEMKTGVRHGQPLRVDELTKVVELTLTECEASLPDDYEAAIRLFTGDVPLTYIIPAKFTGDRGDYTIEHGLIKANADTVTLDYYFTLSPLVADTDTNIVLEKYSQLYLYGALKQLFSFIDEPEPLAKNVHLFSEAIKSVNSLNRARQTSTDRLVMR